MKNVVTTLGVCLALAVGIAAVQNPPTPPPPAQDQQPVPEVTLVGCLIQGSEPTVFIFENVKKDPKDPEEKAVKYVVVAGADDLNLRQHLNHEVRITGVPDGKPATPADQKVEEKDLSRLSAKQVAVIADTCSVPVS
jgi:hypothetical protein